jgi:biotin carboxyl carrier protein
MGSLSSAEQRKLAYFHALGKVMTENSQAVYESKYKSSHNVRLNEIWSDDIAWAETYADAVSGATTNSAITFLEEVVLDEIYGSNGQAYAFISGGTFKDDSYPIAERGQLTSGATFIRPWISPVDIPHPTTNEPSYGFELRLFRGDDATSGTPGSEIFLTEGAWSVDYYAGIIHFSNDGIDNTPDTLGWGSIKASIFYYSGNFGVSGATGDSFTTAVFDSGTSQLVFNSGETNETIVDLSYLDNNDAYSTVQFDSGTSQLVFNSGETNESIVDLSSLKATTGTTSSLSPANTNMPANATNSGSTLACNTTLNASNVSSSMVAVFVNGVQVNVGNQIDDDCYFSGDGGTTPRASGQEQFLDLLYWNYDVSNDPVIGYELTTYDRITFLHMTI